MANPKLRVRPRESFRTEEEYEKERLRIRRLQETRLQIEANRDGRPSTNELVKEYDPLLDALIKEHPEKDPANTKS